VINKINKKNTHKIKKKQRKEEVKLGNATFKKKTLSKKRRRRI
jgi:hypothetical protein